MLSYDDQAENWRMAIAKVRKVVGDWGIKFPAIPELDIEGVNVGNIRPPTSFRYFSAVR